jgi:hypothetical protein
VSENIGDIKNRLERMEIRTESLQSSFVRLIDLVSHLNNRSSDADMRGLLSVGIQMCIIDALSDVVEFISEQGNLDSNPNSNPHLDSARRSLERAQELLKQAERVGNSDESENHQRESRP